jgi:Flp pilus assembly protein TadG
MRGSRNIAQRGNAAVEFALGFTVLWLSFSGVWQYGYAMFIYDRLATQVANGGRYASRADYRSDDESFRTAVKNMVVYGNPEGTGAATIADLGVTAVDVVTEWSDAGLPVAITLSIRSYTVNTILQQIVYTNKPRVTVKYVGQYKTPGAV